MTPQSFKIIKGKKPEPKCSYPFHKMEINDAFFLPCPQDLRQNFSAQVHNAARRYRETHNPDFRITVRSVETPEGSGLMIYRKN